MYRENIAGSDLFYGVRQFVGHHMYIFPVDVILAVLHNRPVYVGKTVSYFGKMTVIATVSRQVNFVQTLDRNDVQSVLLRESHLPEKCRVGKQ